MEFKIQDWFGFLYIEGNEVSHLCFVNYSHVCPDHYSIPLEEEEREEGNSK